MAPRGGGTVGKERRPQLRLRHSTQGLTLKDSWDWSNLNHNDVTGIHRVTHTVTHTHTHDYNQKQNKWKQL